MAEQHPGCQPKVPAAPLVPCQGFSSSTLAEQGDVLQLAREMFYLEGAPRCHQGFVGRKRLGRAELPQEPHHVPVQIACEGRESLRFSVLSCFSQAIGILLIKIKALT